MRRAHGSSMAVVVCGALLWVGGCRGPGVRFDAPQQASVATGIGATPAFAVSPRGAEAVAWVSAEGGGKDGRLYVRVADGEVARVEDPLGPIAPHGEAPPKLAWTDDGALLAMYLVGREVPGRRFPVNALRVVRSEDAGRTWSAPATVTDDREEFGSHSFHALHAGRDGAVYVAWLDGRAGKSAAWVTRSRDGGRTWETNRRISPTEACPCCRTALATAPDGALYVAWREVLPGGIRDIVVARSRDGGVSFDPPRRVHADDWTFDGCPHAGPALQVDDAGRIHVVWWTGKDGGAGVWYARSDDGAHSFRAPVAIAVAPQARPAHAQVAVSPDGARVVVVWDEPSGRTPRILLRRSRDGGASFAAPVPVSDSVVAATYPVLALRDSAIIVGWAEQSAVAQAHADHARPNMKRPDAVMPLPSVGSAQVMVRRGVLARE